MLKQATCAIQVTPQATAIPTRALGGKVDMSISIGCKAQAEGITLVIKGKHLERVLGLASLIKESDAMLAELVREVHPEMAGQSDEECAQYAREQALEELKKLGGSHG